MLLTLRKLYSVILWTRLDATDASASYCLSGLLLHVHCFMFYYIITLSHPHLSIQSLLCWQSPCPPSRLLWCTALPSHSLVRPVSLELGSGSFKVWGAWNNTYGVKTIFICGWGNCYVKINIEVKKVRSLTITLILGQFLQRPLISFCSFCCNTLSNLYWFLN